MFVCWPETIYLFIQNHMACPGCYLAKFESLGSALQIYQIAPSTFLDDLHQIITEYDRDHQTSPRTKGENQV
ncbi:MAG TPA: hypothetical protein DEH22_01470 [Chloroflexi bacterium]|nr:hypothetical protein [Chloroflexota bacterium]